MQLLQLSVLLVAVAAMPHTLYVRDDKAGDQLKDPSRNFSIDELFVHGGREINDVGQGVKVEQFGVILKLADRKFS
jgi:hypothetical protein